jgi:hypothetical protein
VPDGLAQPDSGQRLSSQAAVKPELISVMLADWAAQGLRFWSTLRIESENGTALKSIHQQNKAVITEPGAVATARNPRIELVRCSRWLRAVATAPGSVIRQPRVCG